MLLKKVLVSITKDPMTTISRECFSHEVPLFKLIHGDTAVNVVGDASPEECLVEAEYGRLEKVFGKDRENNISRVEKIYGHSHSDNLERAIKDTSLYAPGGRVAPPEELGQATSAEQFEGLMAENEEVMSENEKLKLKIAELEEANKKATSQKETKPAAKAKA